jgi:hypothetical protein
MAYMKHKLCIMIAIQGVPNIQCHQTRSITNRRLDAAELNPRSILPRIDGFELICLALNIKASDFQDAGHKANPWPSFYLDDDVQGIGDIGLNREIGHLDTAL